MTADAPVAAAPRRTSRARAAAIGTATVVVLLAVWEAAVRFGGLPPFILPAPSAVAAAAVEQAPQAR
ncbi:hypothetical protein [Demequina litorisediminis]|uniref:ABC transporter permease n=1 Tax=Demequina litorisediminis TaxID=1849022 RepID=A0ABQ6ID11_9MICO|nr:hypothetical protein [Demequina litorisediminis]GMA34619.1 hypothetical protein GCM10025876_08230 [Demequina litorisediminis]